MELADPEPEILVAPGDPLSVVGFPFGKTAEGYGIWATGTLASEPEVDVEQLPMFYIDCRTRQGQSGSIVVAHRSGGWVRVLGGKTILLTEPMWTFLGIYSGRIHADSDIGRVWRRSAIRELVAAT